MTTKDRELLYRKSPGNKFISDDCFSCRLGDWRTIWLFFFAQVPAIYRMKDFIKILALFLCHSNRLKSSFPKKYEHFNYFQLDCFGSSIPIQLQPGVLLTPFSLIKALIFAESSHIFKFANIFDEIT